MKTREDFEQMVLDTRPDLDRAIEAVAGEAISTALALVERHMRSPPSSTAGF